MLILPIALISSGATAGLPQESLTLTHPAPVLLRNQQKGNRWSNSSPDPT